MKPPEQRSKVKSIVSPIFDFFLLGGASLIIFPLIMHYFPNEKIAQLKIIGSILAASIILEYLINFPHFAYSYQLLYQNFPKKITGQIDPLLKNRYIFAGIIAPVLMIIFFTASYLQNSTMLLKYAVNVMLLTAGWHYAKQGFGILIVLSVYKGIFYKNWERKLILANAHLLWVYAWIMFNTGSREKNYFGISFHTLGLPSMIEATFTYLVILSTISLIIVFLNKCTQEKILLSFNGITAYAASAYLWVILRFGLGFDSKLHPLFLFIPAMHSIQYIAIVLKMKKNEMDKNFISLKAFMIFIMLGIIIGAVIFKELPEYLDQTVGYNTTIYGPAFFMFIFWVFINIHHYFIDNVIWRREGSEAKTYLFSAD